MEKYTSISTAKLQLGVCPTDVGIAEHRCSSSLLHNTLDIVLNIIYSYLLAPLELWEIRAHILCSCVYLWQYMLHVIKKKKSHFPILWFTYPLLFFLHCNKFLFITCVCLSVCMVHQLGAVPVEVWRGHWISRLGLQGCEPLCGCWEIEPRSSARAINAFKHWAVIPAPQYIVPAYT